MIVLDTNVLSEMIRPEPAESVARWVVRVGSDQFATTAVTRAEMYYGLALMPAGRRKDNLRAAIERLFQEQLAGATLDFTSDAAPLYGEIVAQRRLIGRPILPIDAMIAAITRLYDATLATRNTADFADCGIEVVNPWES